MNDIAYSAAFRRLPDPWARGGGLPLDGPLETHAPSRFWLLLGAFFVALAAVILFQVVSAVVALTLLLLKGVPPEHLMTAMSQELDQHAHALFIGNTVGQVVGLLLPAVLLVRLHARRRWGFLRLRASTGPLLVLSLLALVAFTPVVQWLGSVNQALPLPDYILDMDAAQMALIEQVLRADTSVWFNLVVLALTPAICEEVLFRGYVQRHAERALGAAGGIVFSGVLFGVYHLRLTQVMPLTALGLLLAYLTWRTGSLWPAILVHFANNAFAVFLGAAASGDAEKAQALDQMEIPWYFVAGGALLFVGLLAALRRVALDTLARRRRAEGGG